MRTGYRWLLLIIVALALAGCGASTTKKESTAAAQVEPVEGSEFKRVILTEKATERLGIETRPVRAETLARTRWVGGAVETSAGEATASATGGGAHQISNRIAVRLSEGELQRVDRAESFVVHRLGSGDDADEGPDDDLPGELDGDSNGDDSDDANGDGSGVLHVVVNDPNGALAPGQPVMVRLTLSGGAAERKIVDFASLIYGLHGESWVYTNPEPRVFVRQPVTVDFIEGDRAVLSEGPAVGTEVVTLGAAELFGVESGVGGGH